MFHVDDIDAEFITRWDIDQSRVEIKAKVCKGDNNRYFVMGRHQKFEYNDNNVNYFAVTFRYRESSYRKLFRCEIDHDEEFLSAETYVDTERLCDVFERSRYKGELILKLNYEMIEYDSTHNRCTRRINHKPADDLILLYDGILILLK
ncbi:Clcn7 [Acrasis kona]|uniref:Clcn7 n=1 Tax=Acrasis kona TaxID=1008807 RepID=A0AAW2YMV6_9EUKA